MKQILPRLKELNKHLTFTKKAFTKGGFRHVTQYIDGIITLQRKTARQISAASLDETHHAAMSRMLTEAVFKQELLEERYVKKIRYLTKGQYTALLFDDTLVERAGKCVEEAQYHKDHVSNGYVYGHQFFTSIIHTPFLQLPLFPQLYSKNTESKIDMARNLVDFVQERMHIDAVMFDSWYSDKKLINKCKTKGITVYCCIKRNRNISLKKGEWQRLSSFADNIPEKEFQHYYIDEIKYDIASHRVKLNGIPFVHMLTSYEWDEKKESWKKPFHLISTNIRETPVHIIRAYRIRWFIETYHRDMKQNLGFAQAFVRKKTAIVRHSIFASLAYTTLKLYMFFHGLTMTIGECITHIQDTEMNNFIREIIEIEDKETRINYFEEVFIRKTAKV